MKKLKIYPSSASFMKGISPDVDYPDKCLRQQLVKHKIDYRPDIPKLYTAIGEIDEASYEYRLNMQDNVESAEHIEREVSFKKELDNYIISGRMDFKVQYKDGTKEIIEKKSSISKSNRLSVIRKKTIKDAQLAQLVTYLVTQKVNNGRLVYSYWEFDYTATKLTMTEEIEFIIVIQGNDIIVDNVKHTKTVKDLVKFYGVVADTLNNDKIGVRPTNPKTCAWCPLVEQCTSYEVGAISKEEYIKEASEILKNPKKPKDPVIFKPARKPKGE